ncbi:hypothetical protein BJ138DRAFT_1119113 [Hygrophoropsis aurantiaca]|uniref:Uncharacterized protein n=1 Tax=Hygrophoropsis aurantiaca TaxID=72124 RepID=A0ACB7ZUN6_9AGAM|nr:hypothetical protein BJ138DRAFT_1119113 [Hygrophoropsis aurantiaca]
MAHQALPDHIFHIYDWLQNRLVNVVAERYFLRFEASFYGPLNGVLQTYFPLSQRFMIKPQGVIQPDVQDTATNAAPTMTGAEGCQEEEGTEDDFRVDKNIEDSEDFFTENQAANVSMDSYRGVLLERSQSGQRYPDFVVVKAGAGGVMHHDKIILLVEVKKTEEKIQTSRIQIHGYLKNCAAKSRLPFLEGILVVGDTVETYFLDGPGVDATVRERTGSMLTTGQPMKDFLRNLALANWNV